ncbi:hypothetical protein B5F98_07030 [Pseudoflavonifractor sp. An44]|uniref:GDSL-type esterase/lipase family protein n=1 Tax=Pseudoflavonifractor sp. An44 TaxID=1965635 RepID=UPI000B370672|nr:GDSL-type esterase/lipase family protein [Pseudoflavonifractor sp. An44]OUN96690.1 hypothetical protein B5F98_07030 [Pseudoflavonifractor sp. An44]
MMRKKNCGFYYILATVCLISLLSGCGRSTAEHTEAPTASTAVQTQRPAAITAAFLGDSRTEGLQAYSGLKYGDFFYSRGMNVFRVDDEDYKVVTIDGQKYTILEALARKQYQSVYIMMGINELGYPAASFRSGLSKLLQRVNEIQPNAVIYLQTLPPVNEEVAQKNKLDPSLNNTNAATFNQIIKELAAQYKVALIDTASVYRDQNGSLPADLASDGVHFVPSAYRRWVDYMASHTLSFQSFDASRK